MAVENGVQNAELGYLLFPFEQYSNLAGKPLVGGHMEIYEAGTDTKYISYQNWDGAENSFRIPIPNDGRITVLADPTKTFDCYLYDSYNNLVCSRLNVQANVPGNISIKGADTVIKNTDGTLDVSLRTLGNNVREYTVNTHNKVLDVQEPLYFVENSNTATVIGFSGDNYATKDYLTDFVTSSISSKVDVTAYNQDITNINNNITALSADVSGKMDVSKLEYNEDGEISAYNGSAFAGQGGAGDPEVNDLVHSNSATWNDVSAKLDTTAFSTVSGNFLTAIPDNYATKDFVQSSVSSKLDSTAFSTVSGSFLTAHQSLDGLMSASLLGLSGSTITSYNNMPFPLGGGEGDAEVNQIVHANSGDWNNVSAKLDTTAFSTVSGNFLTAHQDLSDYLTKSSADTLYQPIGDYADATALDSKVDTSSFTAFSSTTNEKIEYISGALSGSYELSAGNGIDITDYPNEQKTVISVTAQGGNIEVEDLVTAQSATWDSVTGKQDSLNFEYNNTAISSIDSSSLYDTSAHARINTLAGRINTLSSDKLDTTAFSTVSGNFLTAHQDISNKLDTTAFSDVSGSFLTAVPNTYLQNTDLATSDGKVTAISGIPLSAGGDVPEGVMVESGLEYNAVNEISGYNGSAIAQYGAEKQWLTHDDTIVHVSNSAQYAFGVNLSGISADLARMMGVDETVLFSGTGTTGSFSESLTAFKKVEFHLSDDTTIRQVAILYPDEAPNGNYIVGCASVWTPNTSPVRVLSVSGNMNAFSRSGTSFQWWSQSEGGYASFQTTPIKVVGIGRKN